MAYNFEINIKLPFLHILSHEFLNMSTGNARIKIELEYPLRSSPTIIYQYISNPSGLQSWFADHVGVKSGTQYVFQWEDGTKTEANLVKNVVNKYVKFSISGSPTPDEFLEFRIQQDEITGDVDLLITEFVDSGEEEMAASIWDAAVDNLRYIIGG